MSFISISESHPHSFFSPADSRKGMNTCSVLQLSYCVWHPSNKSFLLTGQDVVLDRAKEIMRLRLKVRRLEAKCLRAYGGHAGPRPDAAEGSDDVAKEETAEGLKTAAGCERQANDKEQGPPATSASADGEEPLVILRNDRSSNTPSILRQLRANKLSDSMATFIPSSSEEAKDVTHQLKVQLLNLEAVMLKWAMKHKELRKADICEETEGNEEPTVQGGHRLRQLLRLESAVKAMFTESQLNAIVRNHEDSSSGDPAEKRRGQRWGEEDLRRMLELRAISSDKVVDHVREKMKIPLPGMKAARLRCKKSPKLNEAYKEMLKKREENQKLCSMCERQMNVIDGVVDGKDKVDDVDEESPFGRKFVQHVPELDQDTAGSRPENRRRTAPTTTSPAKKKKKQRHAEIDWTDTSDSDADLSDPGVWGRPPPPPSRLSWQPEVSRAGVPLGRRPPPHSSTTNPFGYG